MPQLGIKPVVQIVANFSDQALPCVIQCGISSDLLNIHHNSENTCSSVYVRFDYEPHQHELRKRKRETRGKRHQWRDTAFFPQRAGCGLQGSCVTIGNDDDIMACHLPTNQSLRKLCIIIMEFSSVI